MIAVIADDLTGAAELGGIGLSYGLKVRISLDVKVASEIDLLVIATDTRSKIESTAVNDMIEVTKQVAKLNPEVIFKKVDSVLRGYIIPEITAQLKILQLDTALLVSANPALGRTIENGNYFIDGVPISQTAFAVDPEFSAKSSDVLKLLKADKFVYVKKYSDYRPEKGVIVGEVKSEGDLNEWARIDHSDVLLAGASGFFRAILETAGFAQKVHQPSGPVLTGPMLYVLGSAYDKSTALVNKIVKDGGPVCYLNESMIEGQYDDKEFERCSAEITNLIRRNGKAIIAINPLKAVSVSALEIRKKMAQLVRRVFDQVTIKELIIEGGSTAAAILKSLEIETLCPTNEYATGVIRSKVIGRENLYITLKPGSYNWPNQVLTF